MSTVPITLVERPESPFDEPKQGARVGTPGEHSALRRAAARNLRRHWARDFARITALGAADTVTAVLVGIAFGRALAPFPSIWGAIPSYLSLHFPFIGALVLSLAVAGAYRPGPPRKDAARILRAALLLGVLLLYPVLFVSAVAFGKAFVVLTAFTAVGVYAVRWLVDVLVNRVRPVVRSRTILVAQSGQRLSERRQFDAGGERLDVIDTIVLDGASGFEVRQAILELANRIAELGADTVLLWGGLTAREFGVAVDVALASGCRLVAGPSPKARGQIEAHPMRLDGIPFAELTRPHLSAWQYGLKRAMDIVGSVLLLLLFAPLLALVAVVIKRSSPGPILFGQARLGAGGRRFKCYKFRSMRSDAEAVLRADPALHAAYVANWLVVLRQQKTAIVTASGVAMTACRYLGELSKQKSAIDTPV